MTNKEQRKERREEIQNAIFEGFLNIKEFGYTKPMDIATAIKNSLFNYGYKISKTR